MDCRVSSAPKPNRPLRQRAIPGSLNPQKQNYVRFLCLQTVYWRREPTKRHPANVQRPCPDNKNIFIEKLQWKQRIICGLIGGGKQTRSQIYFEHPMHRAGIPHHPHAPNLAFAPF